MTVAVETPLWDAFTHSYLNQAADALWNRLRCSTCDVQDYLQEFRFNLWTRQRRFDPTRARWTTFVRLVTTHQSSELLRRCRRLHISRREAQMESCDFRARTVAPAVAADQRMLRRDLHQAVSKLSDADQVICRLLASHSVTEAARRLEIPRSTLVDRISRIRRRFEAAHLDDYLGIRP